MDKGKVQDDDVYKARSPWTVKSTMLKTQNMLAEQSNI